MTEKSDILYGIHPVTEVLRAKRRSIHQIYVASGKDSKRLGHIIQLADGLNIPVEQMTAGKLTSFAATGAHQGVAARVGNYPYSDLDDIIEAGDDEVPVFLVLLDHIVDPQNLGAVIRTALCAGISGIIIPRDRSAGATPAVSKASAGALEHIRLCRVTNLVNTIRALKDKGFWIMGLDRCGASSVFSTDLTGPMGIVIGGEDTGIRPLVKKHCDGLIFIPQREGVNSLNVSAAGTVVMYEAFRQRYMAQAEEHE